MEGRISDAFLSSIFIFITIKVIIILKRTFENIVEACEKKTHSGVRIH